MITDNWLLITEIPKEGNKNNWKETFQQWKVSFIIRTPHTLCSLFSDLCSLFSDLCSPFTVSCTSIGWFANRPYNRTQEPSYQYREPLLTLRSSFFAFHCSSPLWKTYFLKKTKKHVKVKRKNVSLSLQNKANTIQIIITKKWYKKSLVSGCF